MAATIGGVVNTWIGGIDVSSVPPSFSRVMGVYAITHTPTGTRYIGSSVFVTRRYSEHRIALRKGSHGNRALQRDWTRDGEAAFVFSLLERVAKVAELGTAEHRWIASTPLRYNTDHAPARHHPRKVSAIDRLLNELIPSPLAAPDGLRERFWSHVTRAGDDECWLWQGTTIPGGYGMFYLTVHDTCLAHRVSYHLAFGPIPRRKLIRHTCDTPPCVNPAHLVPGTPLHNARDTIARGRRGAARGEKTRAAKLTANRVMEIRALYAADATQTKEIARRFGVAPTTIRRIALGHYWSHLPGAVSPIGIRRGGRHRNAVLTEDQASEIRRRYAAGVTPKVLAHSYAVSLQTIMRVVKGREYTANGDAPLRRMYGISRFTDDQLRDIRAVHATEGLTYQQVADRYAATYEEVRGIIKRSRRARD